MSRKVRGLPWLIMEMRTGALDGWYREEADARAVLAQMRERYPGGYWVLLEAHDFGPDGARIPNSRFWLNCLGQSDAIRRSN